MRKKRRSSHRWDWFLNRPFKWTFGLGAVVAIIFGNYFAHLPTETRAKFGQAQIIFESFGAATAGITDNLGLTGQDASIEYIKEPPLEPLPFGMPKAVDFTKAPRDIQVFKRKGYWVGYSPSLRRPVWAAYAVTADMLTDTPQDRPPRFYHDSEAPSSPYHEDYTNSDYDRGHMAPNYAIATRYGRKAQLETFLLTNIVPQRPDLNRGPWRVLEGYIADTLTDRMGTIWVIVATDRGDETINTIKRGETHINIPEGLAMILASVQDDRLYAIGVYMPQETPGTKRPRYCFRSVRWIEERTGLDFFSDLSQERQDRLETVEVSRFWPSMNLFDPY